TAALSKYGSNASLDLPKRDYKDPLSCATTLRNMKGEYKAKSATKMGKLSRSMPLSLSNMWEATGLKLWMQAQFGYDSQYAHYMFCRQLDQTANISPKGQYKFVGVGAPGNRTDHPDPTSTQTNPHSLAWDTVS